MLDALDALNAVDELNARCSTLSMLSTLFGALDDARRSLAFHIAAAPLHLIHIHWGCSNGSWRASWLAWLLLREEKYSGIMQKRSNNLVHDTVVRHIA
jgi:hypothetical protein